MRETLRVTYKEVQVGDRVTALPDSCNEVVALFTEVFWMTTPIGNVKVPHNCINDTLEVSREVKPVTYKVTRVEDVFGGFMFVIGDPAKYADVYNIPKTGHDYQLVQPEKYLELEFLSIGVPLHTHIDGNKGLPAAQLQRLAHVMCCLYNKDNGLPMLFITPFKAIVELLRNKTRNNLRQAHSELCRALDSQELSEQPYARLVFLALQDISDNIARYSGELPQ